jgi:predicted aspartyl protease
MGCFATSVQIENAERRGERLHLPNVLVDTGSEFTWVPGGLLREFGIRRERTQRFVVADGRVLVRDIGFAIVHVAGVSTADDVVFGEPGDLGLLGARSLEGLNLRVDPQRKTLVPAGPIVTARVA